jgi:hypothetical protein
MVRELEDKEDRAFIAEIADEQPEVKLELDI